jgi:single-strand DNA-binding protein
MARNVNKAILIGYVGSEPETRTFDSGSTLLSFRVATTAVWKQNGEKKERTEWHSISCWGKLAESLDWLEKGSLVYIEGEIRYSTYEKDGETRYRTDIHAQNISVLKSKGDGGEGRQQSRGQRRQKPSRQQSLPDDGWGDNTDGGDGDDDVPF